jgi:Uma2 family endonuclease
MKASILNKTGRDKALLGASDLHERDTQGVAMFERSSDKTISYYYDSHPTEEDLMGESSQHHAVIGYLEELLTWLFHQQACAVYVNLNFYATDDEDEYPIVPDVAVIKGVPFRHEISWRIGVTGPAPQVVFEMASDKTWKRDLDEKPPAYARIGVQEYYAFDPYEPPLPLSRRRGRRLFGWHVDADTGLMRQRAPRPDGSLWSPQLNSWLRPDGMFLRLYDPCRRLTKGEVDEAKVEREALARQAESARAEREALARQAEAERAEAAIRQMQVEAARAEAFAEKLRALGIDPDQPL